MTNSLCFNNQNYNIYFREAHEFLQHLLSFTIVLQVFVLRLCQKSCQNLIIYTTLIIYGQMATSK